MCLCWILSGGFRDDLKEDLDSLEQYFKDVLVWNLDGLSFFDDEIEELNDWIESYNNLDHIWKTIDGWKAIYSMVGENAEFNQDQYVVLVNDTLKEYMIIYSDFLENGFEDEYFKYVYEDEFIKIIENLKEKNYKMLSYSEEWFYLEIANKGE